MAELRDYEVLINGNAAVLRLTAEDAARYGATPVEPAKTDGDAPDRKARKAVANKARTPAD